MAQTITYQQLFDKLKADGSFDVSGLPLTVSIQGTVTIDLQQYQDAVLKLNFKEFTDNTFTSEVTAITTDPSVEEVMNITKQKLNNYVPDADGGSIFINGDRIVINAKSDYAMLFGQKGVAIASPNRVNIDAGESITLFGHGNQGVFIGLPNKGLRIPKASAEPKASGNTKGDPTPDYLYEPMILGVKLANLLEDILFVLQGASMASSLSEAKWQPSTVAEFALLANRIPEILSNYAYIDGISHEKIDQDRLQNLIQQQRAAAPLIAPTSISATVQGTISPAFQDSSPYASPNPSANPIGQNTIVPGGGGYVIVEKSKTFINNRCGGVSPVTMYADGTAVVDRVEGDRSYLVPNPSFAAGLTVVKLPTNKGLISITAHPDFAAKLAVAFAEIAQNGGGQYITNYGGGFVPRNVTGGIRLSHHSYAFAIDVNNLQPSWAFGASWNLDNQTIKPVGSPLRPWNETERGFYNKFASVMVKNGITWLYRGDPMHFSIYE